MQGLRVPHHSHELCGAGLLSIAMGLELGLHVGLRGALLGEGLAVRRTLLRRVRHQSLVVRLRILLNNLGLLHLLVEVGHEEVDHRDHAVALLALLRVRPERLRRRRRRGLVAGHGAELHKGGADASARDAAGGRGGIADAHAVGDAVALGKLRLRGRLIHFRVVKFVEPILRPQQNLLRSAIAGHQLLMLGILLLTLLRCLGNALIERLDTCLQRRDLLGQLRDVALHLVDGRLGILEGLLELLRLVLGLVELRLAVLLLVVVGLLLLAEICDHSVNHVDDLAEADGFAIQRQRDQVEARRPALVGRLPEQTQRLRLLAGHGHLQLQEA
mmetsp:Transcript_73492/g.212870  ORF Transcript_73492/g.212870 Transcript_73492/m.212870 type:complete len:330 (-) Transcript_73492:407-1396(-)